MGSIVRVWARDGSVCERATARWPGGIEVEDVDFPDAALFDVGQHLHAARPRWFGTHLEDITVAVDAHRLRELARSNRAKRGQSELSTSPYNSAHFIRFNYFSCALFRRAGAAM